MHRSRGGVPRLLGEPAPQGKYVDRINVLIILIAFVRIAIYVGPVARYG